MGLPPDAIPACQQMRQQLLAQVTTLDLPPNFLDQLIDELGGPTAVAEMTGRKGRVVREQRRVGGVLKSSGRVVYELRAKPDSSEMDSLNGECCWCCVGLQQAEGGIQLVRKCRCTLTVVPFC